MAVTDTSLATKAIFGKEATDDNKRLIEEFGAETINIVLDEVWTVSPDPTPATAVSDGYIQLFTLYALTEDPTVPSGQAWRAGGATPAATLRDWMPPDKFGPNYGVAIFDNTDTQISTAQQIAAGMIWNDKLGILTVNSGHGFSTPFKITHYRYIGPKGTGSAPVSAAGANGEVQFASDGLLASDSRLVWDPAGETLVVGTPINSPVPGIWTSGRLYSNENVQIVNESNGNGGFLSFWHDDSGAGAGSNAIPVLNFNTSRGTAASPTTLLTGDIIGEFKFLARGPTGYNESAWIRSYVEGFDGSFVEGYMQFSTNPGAPGDPLERMRITSDGRVGIGATAPGHTLTVRGNIGMETSGSGVEGVFGFTENVQVNLRAESGRRMHIGANGSNDGIIIGTNLNVGVGASPSATTGHRLRVDGYVVPLTDNIDTIGTPSLRWKALHVGPASLHINATAAEIGEGPDRQWTLGINTASGDANVAGLRIRQGNDDHMFIRPDGTGVVPNRLVVGVSTFNTSLPHTILSPDYGSNTHSATRITMSSDLNFRANTNHVFTNAAGTEIMRLTGADQRVGIGSVVPVNLLDVDGGMVIGDGFAGVETAPTNGLLIEGNLGVATNTPNARLEVEDGGTTAATVVKVTADDQNVYGLVIGNDTFSAVDTDGLAFVTNNAGLSSIEARGTNAALNFITPGGGSAMRIANDGSVGIGTTSPTNTLEVNGTFIVGDIDSPYDAMIFESFAVPETAGFNGEMQIRVPTQPGSGVARHLTRFKGRQSGLGQTRADVIIDGYLGLGLNNSFNTSRLRIEEDMDNGVHGIEIQNIGSGGSLRALRGLNSGGGELWHISEGGLIRADNGVAGFPAYTFVSDVNTGMYRVTTDTIGFSTAGTERLRIDSIGNVGVGFVVPNEKLTIEGGAISLDEIAAPSATAGYGKLYVSSVDGDVHYVDGLGTDTNLVTAGGGGGGGGGGDGYVVWDVLNVQTAAITADYGQVVRCNPSSGAFTVTLPPAADFPGQQLVVKNVTSSTVPITIDGDGSDTIDDELTVTIEEPYKAITFVSYGGTQWGRI